MNEVIRALKERRSIRAYEARQIPEDVLEQILEAGLYAPSGRGVQPVTRAVPLGWRTAVWSWAT